MRDIATPHKWALAVYKYPFSRWTPPEILYPCQPREKDALHALKNTFQPLPVYKDLEKQAIEENTLVSIEVPLPAGQIAFLENTAEKCTSPQTKHSREGMQGARHWVQRVDTPDAMFRRLTDGYGVSLMFGERCHQYIRNSNNWRGISGVMLDIDVFQDDEHPDAPKPVYSQDELFDRYPLIPRICSYLIPSASSLYDGRPFKARGIVLFSQPITDQRAYRAFGDILCGEIDCIPANVTKNPVAVGFGNTHNAPQVYRNNSPDTDWIAEKTELAKTPVISTAKQRNREQKKKADRKAHYATQGRGTGGGENISAFIEQCNAVTEMVGTGLLTPGRGNEYRWHESENDRSCEIFGDGVIQIFSHTMQAASPAAELEPVNAHRFYLYQLAGLDLAKESDKPKCREYLFDRGYGSDPKAFAKKNKRRAPVRLSHLPDYKPRSAPLETVRKLNHDGVSEWLGKTSLSIPDYEDPVKPILKRITGKKRILIKNRWHSQQFGWWNCAKDGWNAMRKMTQDRIKRTRYMLVMTGGAGGGKSTVARDLLENFADISPTTAQADEKYDDAQRLGRNAMRHRSRNYNRGLIDPPLGLGDGCMPCATPDTPNALAQMGGSPVSEFCKPHCPRFEECTDYGYLSQWRIFKDYSEIYLSYQDDIFSDPLYAGYIEKMGGNTKDFVLALDEADPASLPPARGYVTDRLKKAADDYRGFESGKFLNALLRETSTATTPLDWTNAVKTVLDMYDDDSLNEIDTQLQGIPVAVTFDRVNDEDVEYDLTGRAMYFTLAHVSYRDKKQTCAVLCDEIDDSVYEVCTKKDYPPISEKIVPADGYTPGVLYDRFLYLETFCRIGFGNLNTSDDVLKLPHRYRNLTADLRAFIETVNSDTPAANEETTTFVVDGKRKKAHVGWTYYLRPDMNARRGILISASGGFDEITEMYKDNPKPIHIEHLTTPPAEWEPGNRVFQISTGRYTPKSALFVTEEGEIVGIKNRCESFLSAIHTEVSQHPQRSLVVVPKALTAEGELAELEAVRALCELEHVEVINHFHAEGTNRYTGVENLFILHFEPSVDETKSIVTRIHRDETIPFDREIVDLEKDGVKLEGVYRYTDPRVQAIFDRECEKRVYQTLMRGRQMLETGVDCYVFLFSAEPISGLPVKPIFFEFDDLVKCQSQHGTLRKLEAYLESKADMSVEELAELDGKSVRTAYRQTQPTRKQAKAEKDAELLHEAKALIHKGASQRGAAAMLGIPLSTFQRLLKAEVTQN